MAIFKDYVTRVAGGGWLNPTHVPLSAFLSHGLWAETSGSPSTFLDLFAQGGGGASNDSAVKSVTFHNKIELRGIRK